MEIYAVDSLLTLNAPAAVLLVGLALTMAVFVLWLVRLVARRQIWPARLMIALVAIYLYEWLSPQVFYEYYRLLFPDLPAQWVARPPGPFALGRLMTFTDQANLSFYSRGVLAWAIILAALWPCKPSVKGK